MPRFLKKISKKTGLPPGTLVHVGERRIEKARIRVIDYNEKELEERDLKTIEECFPYKDKPTVTWINIDGLHDVDIVKRIGEEFDLHSLVLEDVVNTGQRPKMEDFEEYIFITSKMLFYDGEENQIKAEQFSLVLGANYVISFQERVGDVFDPIRERMRKGKGRIRKKGADYLAYALVDAIVDNYFILLENLGEKIESLEEEVVTDPDPDTLQEIHNLKRELIFLRKSVWPLREVINGVERGESCLIQESTRIFLRDIYDHTVQVIDTIESYRDIAFGMMDVYLSSISNRMNQVMKLLTVIATVFIPLTFIAGIYGMNFKYMPELEWHWGYPVALSIMVAIGMVMVVWFKRKRFL